MKYFVRVIKYYVYLALMLVVFILVLSMLGLVGSTPEDIFRDGTRSLWQIAGICAVFALIYPRLAFGRRTAHVSGSYEELRQPVVDAMHARGYILESEAEESMTFRQKSPVVRLFQMFEDRVTLTKTLVGFELEGQNKALVRVVSALEAIDLRLS